MDSFGRYTLEDVKEHKSYDDAWTVLNGKVYNMTAYLPFHPGGEKEIMRCAGRDGTRLFSKRLLFFTSSYSFTRRCRRQSLTLFSLWPLLYLLSRFDAQMGQLRVHVEGMPGRVLGVRRVFLKQAPGAIIDSFWPFLCHALSNCYVLWTMLINTLYTSTAYLRSVFIFT